MEPIEKFAKAQVPTGEGKNNVFYSDEVIEYLNEVSDVRPYFKRVPMGTARAKSVTIRQKEGIAAQIVGNAEVPRARDVEKKIYIELHRNASGYDINWDDKIENADNPNFEREEYDRALERLDLKERADCAAVMIAGAGTGTSVPEADFDVQVVREAITEFNSLPWNRRNKVKADTIFLSEKSFRKVIDSEQFKFIPELYKGILLQGSIGNVIDGLDTVIFEELEDTVIIAAIKQEPLWLAENNQSIVAVYDDPKYLTNSVDFRHDEEALCAYSQYLSSIQIVPGVLS